jgi:hypothetical protein
MIRQIRSLSVKAREIDDSIAMSRAFIEKSFERPAGPEGSNQEQMDALIAAQINYGL